MIEFYSGFIAGLAQTIVGFPLDTIIVYKQTGKNISNIKLKNIYKGVQYPLISNGLINSACFGLNYNIYKYTHNHYISGAITGIITSIMISPMELYKIRAQKLNRNYINPFTGLHVTTIRELISTSLYFGLYNTFIDKNINTFIAGGIAGSISMCFCFPIDVIKTRIQSSECKTINESIKMKNLLRGISVCFYRAFIVNAVGFYIFENSKKFYVSPANCNK